jgi:hypothetical protein
MENKRARVKPENMNKTSIVIISLYNGEANSDPLSLILFHSTCFENQYDFPVLHKKIRVLPVFTDIPWRVVVEKHKVKGPVVNPLGNSYNALPNVNIGPTSTLQI